MKTFLYPLEYVSIALHMLHKREAKNAFDHTFHRNWLKRLSFNISVFPDINRLTKCLRGPVFVSQNVWDGSRKIMKIKTKTRFTVNQTVNSAFLLIIRRYQWHLATSEHITIHEKKNHVISQFTEKRPYSQIKKITLGYQGLLTRLCILYVLHYKRS